MSLSFRAGALSLAVSAALFATPVLADGSKLDEVIARGHLILGTGSTNAPWHFKSAEDKLQGFDVDMGRIIAKALFGDPDKIEYVNQSSDARIPNITTDKVDITCQFMTVTGERACRCPACGFTAYPRISPAMMVLVKKGDAVLLARHSQSPYPRFTALAGFLEAGESAEEAVHREVMEEVGLRVHNLRYFGSQSWPFPHSLMIAFTAEYLDGEIRTDPAEIAEARWFGPDDDFPEIPPGVSIASALIGANRPGRR